VLEVRGPGALGLSDRIGSGVGGVVCLAVGKHVVHVRLGPGLEAAHQLMVTVTGTVGVAVRVTRPSRSRERNVWVSIFWLTPASRRINSE